MLVVIYTYIVPLLQPMFLSHMDTYFTSNCYLIQPSQRQSINAAKAKTMFNKDKKVRKRAAGYHGVRPDGDSLGLLFVICYLRNMFCYPD